MNLLRLHPTLTECLRRELPQLPNPRQAAAAILQKTNGAPQLVLYTDRAGHWLVVPVGPACELHNLGQAARLRLNGKRAVAYVNTSTGASPA